MRTRPLSPLRLIWLRWSGGWLYSRASRGRFACRRGPINTFAVYCDRDDLNVPKCAARWRWHEPCAIAAKHWPAQPSPTIAKCSTAAMAGSKSNATVVRPAPACHAMSSVGRSISPIWKPEAALKCRSCKRGRYAPPCTRQADKGALVHPDEDGVAPKNGPQPEGSCGCLAGC
jgi:hypothetical protein